jgi:hypothetical protein
MAAASLRRAVELARSQGSLSLELRATTSLVALCSDCGDVVAYRRGLERLVERFGADLHEGDVQRARATLAAAG